MATSNKRGHRQKQDQSGETPAEYPYTMKLPNGRTVYVEIPGEYVTTDKSGETAFLPPAVHLLDRVKVMAMSLADRVPTPGHLKTLRRTLGLTLEQMGERIGVDKMTVWRWESGAVRPSEPAIKAVERLRKDAARKGVLIPS